MHFCIFSDGGENDAASSCYTSQVAWPSAVGDDSVDVASGSEAAETATSQVALPSAVVEAAEVEPMKGALAGGARASQVALPSAVVEDTEGEPMKGALAGGACASQVELPSAVVEDAEVEPMKGALAVGARASQVALPSAVAEDAESGTCLIRACANGTRSGQVAMPSAVIDEARRSEDAASASVLASQVTESSAVEGCEEKAPTSHTTGFKEQVARLAALGVGVEDNIERLWALYQQGQDLIGPVDHEQVALNEAACNLFGQACDLEKVVLGLCGKSDTSTGKEVLAEIQRALDDFQGGADDSIAVPALEAAIGRARSLVQRKGKSHRKKKR